jgi:hypothetical protein
LEKTEVLDNENYRIYSTDVGAFGSFGIVVKKEIKLFPGFVYLKYLGDQDHTFDANIFKDSNGEIIIDYDFGH